MLCLGVPKTTLRSSDLLEGLTELGKAIMSTVMVHYTVRIQMEISKGQGSMWHRVLERPGISFQLSPPSESWITITSPSDHV